MCLIEFTKRWPGLERFVCFSDLTDSGNTHPTIMRFLRWFNGVQDLCVLSNFFFLFRLSLERRGVVVFYFFFFPLVCESVVLRYTKAGDLHVDMSICGVGPSSVIDVLMCKIVD